MLFTSLEFLLLFLPAAVIVNFFLPTRMRNYWLLIASLFFYAWGEPKFVLIMLLSIFLNYAAALHIEELRPQSPCRRLLLAAAVLLNLGILFVFKYLNFVISNILAVFPDCGIQQTSITLPIGISFFTFQALSYVIDVYRGVPAQKNLFHLGLYISFFPQLIAGPIVRYTEVAEQIQSRKTGLHLFSAGLMRFVLGFNKKMLLSNLLAEVADYAFALPQPSAGMAWLGSICYTLQIFFDFSGYSDMAIGLGKIFGFHFSENFNYPYTSKTLTEFWRRWHISLGSWFRDYVYFPLGGSRVSSRWRLVLNLSAVWLATGIWHGASWHFILWGVLHGAVITLEKLFGLPEKLKAHRFAAGIYQAAVLLLVNFGWVLFRADSLPKAWAYLQAMFGMGGAGWVDREFLFWSADYLVIILFAALSSVAPVTYLKGRLPFRKDRIEACGGLCFQLIQAALFIISISFLVINAHNPFIYFNF